MSTAPPIAPAELARGDRAFYAFNAVLSAGALAFLAWLLLFRREAAGGWDLDFMPAVNAGLNASATALLLSGYWAIRTGRRRAHKYLMVAAFAASSLFLAGYVAYHAAHGDTRFAGQGLARGLYFAILATHVLASATIPPLSLTLLYLAARSAFPRHKRLARLTLPIWLYVSATGVLIYFLLHVWFRSVP